MNSQVLRLALGCVLVIGVIAEQNWECDQNKDAPDDGVSNWGDLTCGNITDGGNLGELVSHEILVNQPGTDEINYMMMMVGYNITQISTYNFGRQRGFTAGIAYSTPDDGEIMSSAGLTLLVDQGQEMRVILEIYAIKLDEEASVLSRKIKYTST